MNYKTADRSGAPFAEFMEAMAEYRRLVKDKDPVSPWARQRTCTSYMKRRVGEHYVASLGVDAYDTFVGLRADEEHRVRKLAKADTQAKTYLTPLFRAGITKDDVMEFWSQQAFDLEIADHQGNCTGCFMKDQSDLARVLQEPETDAAWWIDLESKYDRFGGQDFAGYARLAKEGPQRVKVEHALRNGDPLPYNDEAETGMDPRRYRLVVIQERNRLRGERKAFSCSCEASMVTDDDDADGPSGGRAGEQLAMFGE